jgi:hypothetical protein
MWKLWISIREQELLQEVIGWRERLASNLRKRALVVCIGRLHIWMVERHL